MHEARPGTRSAEAKLILSSPVLVLAVHGTRSATGARTTREIAEALQARCPEIELRIGYLDVQQPSLGEVLDELGERPAVVVPLLLSRGYHVDTDLPALVAGRAQFRLAAHVGPHPAVIEAVAERVLAAETAPSQITVLAVVGSSRASARDEVAGAARLLGARLGREVQLLDVTTDAATQLATLVHGADRTRTVTVASYLIAPGLFLDRIRDAGLPVAIAEPIGAHPGLLGLVLDRFDAAR